MQCSLGLQAVADVAATIKAGFYDIGIGAGLESMTTNPMAWEGSVNPRVQRMEHAQNCLLPMVITSENAKIAVGPDKLAELSLIDPKRAKRILANRQSAARSKERKIHYTNELERKVQTLQTEATTLSAQVTMLQRDTTGMTIENKELKLRLQAMEQQAHLRDALNETLREEVQRLKIATGQVPAANGNSFNRALPPQFSFHHFGNRQAQQPQQQQQQLHMPHSTNNNNQTRSVQPQPSFADFNHRV